MAPELPFHFLGLGPESVALQIHVLDSAFSKSLHYYNRKTLGRCHPKGVAAQQRLRSSLPFPLITISKFPTTFLVSIAFLDLNMGSKSPKGHQQTLDGMIYLPRQDNRQFSPDLAT
jgi:hypothetical protein